MKRVSILFAALIAAVPAFGFAWGSEGHQIASHIAQSRLSPEAAAWIAELLDGKSIAEVSTWADEIRNLPPHAYSRPLHYVNIEKGAEEYDAERDCPDGACVVEAIIKYRAVLREPATPIEEQKEALKFLIHFVQDLHQPLHASQAGDRGGNDIQVRFFDSPMNLHYLWDVGLLQRMERDALELAEEVSDDISTEEAEHWKAFRPVDWANESYRLALANAYPVGDGDLGSDYFEKNESIVLQRLAQAGVRLAGLLNGIQMYRAFRAIDFRRHSDR
jgi:hypothetical protein